MKTLDNLKAGESGLIKSFDQKHLKRFFELGFSFGITVEVLNDSNPMILKFRDMKLALLKDLAGKIYLEN